MPDDQANAEDVSPEEQDKRTCGIIMPISATANHTASHWAAVRTLISRAIEKANFVAAPVWENSSVDRVSERIIGNIFQFPIVVADISDSNPNVMLELGLRLASKRPTVVVVNTGGVIPFDIRDFHALEYPPSLSILEMEQFIADLASVLVAKDEASRQEGYVPFLGKVVVDVVQPGERQVPLEKYVLDRLDEISEKLSRSNSSGKRIIIPRPSNDVVEFINHSQGSAFFFSTSSPDNGALREFIAQSFPNARLEKIGAGIFYGQYALVFDHDMSADMAERIVNVITGLIAAYGGKMGVPSKTANAAAIF